MQTHKTTMVSHGTGNAMKTIIDANPDYDYVFIDDAKARRFLGKHFHPRVLSAFDRLVPGSFKADLFRYCYLFVKGGVYLDADMESIGPLSNIILPDDEFVSYKDFDLLVGPGSIYQAFLACEAKHPIMKTAIEMCLENIENERYTNRPLGITGPGLFGQAFQRAMSGSPKVGTTKGMIGGNIFIGNARKGQYLTDRKNNRVMRTKYKNQGIETWSPNTYTMLWLRRKVFKSRNE